MNPPQPINIVKVKRTRKKLYIDWTQGDDDHDIGSRDNPLPSFPKALDALTPIIASVCHFPPDYVTTNCRVVAFKMGTKGEAPTVSFTVAKGLDDAAKEFVFNTPERLLSHPSEPGTYTPPLTNAEADLVWQAVAEAKQYILGDRAQGQIAFETEEESDDGSGTQEPEGGELINLDHEPKTKRARGRKAVSV